ncbi:MAG: hypothetical protein CBC35_11820 [Planctomycetes bacterium TMED75]|nr:hypothetical protein [Planctomycetaceae bacterium]OUU90418.1 MAG: hypothetical protein CBC35_11820 [Planctomycetes bacterium TMED75]
MRIAISGAQSTGKTTLAHALTEVLDHSRVEPEPFRVLKDRLNLVSGAHTMTPQHELALIKHNQGRLTAFRAGETVLFDRCALDALAHAEVARAAGNSEFTESWLDRLRIETNLALSKIELLLVVRIDPEVPLAEDGVRSTDVEYRILVDQKIAELAEGHPTAQEITGSRSERIDHVCALVEAMRPST